MARTSEPLARSSAWPSRPAVAVPAVASTAGEPRPIDPSRPGSSLADVCWRRRGTVLAGVLACVAGAVLYIVKAPRVFTPTASLYVDSNGLQLLGATKGPAAAAEVESFLLRQCEVIRSERLVRQVVDDNRPDVGLMFPGVVDPVANVQNNLSVAVGKKDDVITVALSTARPAAGARLVNRLVAAYQAYESGRTQARASEAVHILTQEKQRQEHDLDLQLGKIVAFKQANGEMFFATDRGTNITVQNLATISEQVTQARLQAARLHVEYLEDPGRIRLRPWQDAEAQAQALEQLYTQEKAAALKINAATAEYQKLQADADRMTKQCDLLDVRIRELDVAQQGGADIQVLEPAKDEPKPTSPKKTVALLSALGAGAMLGCGLAVVRDATDKRLRSAQQAGRLLGSPVLGVLPEVAVGNDPLRAAQATRRTPDGDLAAAAHALAAEVCFGRPFHAGRSLLVTSPNRGDGKSTVAANLAAAAAHAGRRTLLVDADLRNPVQHRVYDAVGTLGLVDLVVDGFGIDQVVRQTDVRGLSLLPAGQLAGNPVEVIGTAEFAELLRELEERFDLVVIDAPPLLGTGEARVLAANADAAVLVVRAEQTTRQAARLACDRVLGVGCSLLGLVFNGGGDDEAVADVHPGVTGRYRTSAAAWAGPMRPAGPVPGAVDLATATMLSVNEVEPNWVGSRS